MTKRQTFYSFHFANDVIAAAADPKYGRHRRQRAGRTQQWEDVKRKGEAAIETWRLPISVPIWAAVEIKSNTTLELPRSWELLGSDSH